RQTEADPRGAGRCRPWCPATDGPRAPRNHAAGPPAGAAMSGVLTVAAITLSIAFVAGLAAGIAFVIAVSVRRAEKSARRNRGVEQEPPHPPEVWLGDD